MCVNRRNVQQMPQDYPDSSEGFQTPRHSNVPPMLSFPVLHIHNNILFNSIHTLSLSNLSVLLYIHNVNVKDVVSGNRVIFSFVDCLDYNVVLIYTQYSTIFSNKQIQYKNIYFRLSTVALSPMSTFQFFQIP